MMGIFRFFGVTSLIALLANSASGCNYPEGEEYTLAIEPDENTFPISEDAPSHITVTQYTDYDTGHQLHIANSLHDSLDSRTIDYLRDQQSCCWSEVLDMYDTGAPIPYLQMEIFDADMNYGSLGCANQRRGCAGLGITRHLVYTHEMERLNEQIVSGERRSDGQCHNLWGNTVHEFRHAANPMGINEQRLINEGLSEFSEARHFELNPTRYDISDIITEGAFQAGDVVWSSQTETDPAIIAAFHPITELSIRSIGNSVVFNTLEINEQTGSEEEGFLNAYSFGACRFIEHTLACIEPAQDRVAQMTVYDLNGYLIDHPICEENSLRRRFLYHTVDGDIEFFAPSQSFASYRGPTDSLMYYMGYCFWEEIDTHDQNGIHYIVEQMLSHAEANTQTASSFNLFNAVQEATGLDRASVQEIFARYHLEHTQNIGGGIYL